MWSNNYFSSKVMCFLVIPDDDTTYAVIYSTNVNNDKSDIILFERWQLKTSVTIHRNGQQSIFQTYI